MTIETKIMSAIVRADMFLVSAWKYMLLLIAAMGIAALIAIKKL